MNQFPTVCGINNQIIFFNGHASHFDERVLRYMEDRNIQPFVLKLGDSGNDQPNDNGLNAKLNLYYNYAKASWILKYGKEKLLSHHM